VTNARSNGRAYERSHPWINFSINLERASPKFWILLGEARSKCEHIAQVPLKPDTAQRLHQLYLAKGVLATTAIEGNTLSEGDVVKLLEGKLELPPSKQYLAKEINNIVGACNWILNEIVRGATPRLSVELIKNFNTRVLKGLKTDEEAVPGEIRTHSVGVARYRAAPAEDCEYLLMRTCEWLNSVVFEPADNSLPEGDLALPIIKAVLAHLYLAWIHPFADGNGRSARLLEFLILVTSGLPSPAAHLLSNHYNQTRAEYYRYLDRASRAEDGVISFIEYAVTGLVDGLRSQLEVIRGQQLRVIWNDYIHELFEDKNSRADTRRLQLILDISAQDAPISPAKVRELSPRTAAAYATKTPRTLSRDLRALHEMRLIEVSDEGLYANRALILSFLPVRGGTPIDDEEEE